MSLWNEYLGFTKFPPFGIFLAVRSKIYLVWWRVPSPIPCSTMTLLLPSLAHPGQPLLKGVLCMLYASELLAWKFFWAPACTFWRSILIKPSGPISCAHAWHLAKKKGTRWNFEPRAWRVSCKILPMERHPADPRLTAWPLPSPRRSSHVPGKPYLWRSDGTLGSFHSPL